MSLALTKTINYDTPGNFTYNSALVDITTKAALKDLTPSDETFYNNCSQKDAKRSDGSATPTTDTSTISSGKLSLINQSIVYDGTDNVTWSTQGCIRFKYTPLYSGSPASTLWIFNFQQTGSQNNRIFITHSSAGNVTFSMYNSSGTQVFSSTSSWSPTASQEYTFHLNFDAVAGSNTLYIDGVAVISNTSTFTRTSGSLDPNFGRAGATVSSNFLLDDIQIFSAPQTYAAYTEQFTYSPDDPIVLDSTGTGADDFSSFSSVDSASGSDGVRYLVQVDNQYKYWNGSAWANSDGTYAQANTAADINTNASSLDVSSGVSIKIGLILHSDDGYSSPPPESTSVTFDYVFFGAMSAISYCLIHGYVYDGSSAIDGAHIHFQSNGIQEINGNMVSVNERINTRSDGYFEQLVPYTGQKIDYTVEYKDSKLRDVAKTFSILVPNQSTEDIGNLI